MATALQAGAGALLVGFPAWEGPAGPFLRVLPPLVGGMLYARWSAGRDRFSRLVGGALAGGGSTLAGVLLILPFGGARPGAEVVLVSASAAGVAAGLIGAALGKGRGSGEESPADTPGLPDGGGPG